MMFESWKQQYLFVKEYATCSCFNCQYGGEIEDSDDERDYVRKFCTKTLAMMDFQFQFPLCAEWENNDGKLLKDYENQPLFRIDNELFESLDTDYKWSFEEIRGKIESYEKVEK